MTDLTPEQSAAAREHNRQRFIAQQIAANPDTPIEHITLVVDTAMDLVEAMSARFESRMEELMGENGEVATLSIAITVLAAQMGMGVMRSWAEAGLEQAKELGLRTVALERERGN